jgi:hypothetical protein
VWLEESAHTPEKVQLGSGDNRFDKINIDTLKGRPVPGGVDLVTGARWKLTNGTLNLEVGFTKFENKALVSGDQEFRGPINPAPPVVRTQYGESDVSSPLNSTGPPQPHPIKENQHYMAWDATSLENDMGSAVVPFVDLTPVRFDMSKSKAMTGVSIVFKSKQGTGGILGLGVQYFAG